ncbi:hypothetical protein [Amycolatopsis anabasis]|uniref:hypothetical protein n=1 Tax=Amycolatopsis anabasis TaxID=1840409 RepID=UPI00131BB2D1|nr:hypothetical protein [Amycolatopsis anabasis]
MAPNIHMKPDGVHQAGGQLKDLAAQAKGTLGRLFDSSETAANGCRGFTTAGALTGCAQSWQQRTNQLVDEVASAGQGLAAAADKVTAADGEALRRLNAVLGELRQA